MMDNTTHPISPSAEPISVAGRATPYRFDRQRIEQLIVAARSGQTEALGELLAACRKYLNHVAHREVGGALKAKVAVSDIVQDTALDAVKDFANFRGDRLDELLAWLRTILLHNVASTSRRYQRHGKRDLNREIPLNAHELQLKLRDPALSPRSLAVVTEEERRVEQAMDRLPADQKSVILLRHRDHLSFAEIGAALGRSMAAAHKLWARAVLRLQRELKAGDGQD